MKITARAELIKSDQTHDCRPIALIREKLARSRLFGQLDNCNQGLLQALNQILKPLTRQGLPALIRTELTPGETLLKSCDKHHWFAFKYQRKLLGLLRIDRCTLEQLASSYYGGQSGKLYSPLGAPTQSEFRLGLKLMQAVLESMPFDPIKPDELQIELSGAETEYRVAALWSMSFPNSHYTSPMLFAMTDELLGRIGQAAPQYQQADNLEQALEQQLTQIPVKLKLELGWQPMPVQALAELQPGEIIPLNLHQRCPISLGGLTLFYGSVHSHQGKLVARLNQDAFQQNEDDQSGWTNIAE